MRIYHWVYGYGHPAGLKTKPGLKKWWRSSLWANGYPCLSGAQLCLQMSSCSWVPLSKEVVGRICTLATVKPFIPQNILKDHEQWRISARLPCLSSGSQTTRLWRKAWMTRDIFQTSWSQAQEVYNPAIQKYIIYILMKFLNVIFGETAWENKYKLEKKIMRQREHGKM